MITLDQLRAIMPTAGKRAEVFIDPLNRAMDEFKIDTPARAAAFLAQLAHESGCLRYLHELATGAAYDDREDLGNTRPEAIRIAAEHGSTPGRWWRGEGPMQITGFDNMMACSIALYGEPDYLLHHPQTLELPLPGSRSAGWFWKTHNLNKWADAGDFDGVSDVINRGRKTEKDGDANGYADRLAYFERAQRVLA